MIPEELRYLQRPAGGDLPPASLPLPCIPHRTFAPVLRGLEQHAFEMSSEALSMFPAFETMQPVSLFGSALEDGGNPRRAMIRVHISDELPDGREILHATHHIGQRDLMDEVPCDFVSSGVGALMGSGHSGLPSR